MVEGTQADLHLEIEDELSDFVANLVSETGGETILKWLFDVTPGQWTALHNLSTVAPTINQRLKALEQQAAGKLHVMWADFPGSVYGVGYCTISVFVESLHWHALAVYNKARLDRMTPEQ